MGSWPTTRGLPATRSLFYQPRPPLHLCRARRCESINQKLNVVVAKVCGPHQSLCPADPFRVNYLRTWTERWGWGGRRGVCFLALSVVACRADRSWRWKGRGGAGRGGARRGEARRGRIIYWRSKTADLHGAWQVLAVHGVYSSHTAIHLDLSPSAVYAHKVQKKKWAVKEHYFGQ